ncbi:MAG: CotH kinase family protein [Verrucomicrobiia bacterium]
MRIAESEPAVRVSLVPRKQGSGMRLLPVFCAALVFTVAADLAAQVAGRQPGSGGFRRGGPGFMEQTRLVERFDKDGDKRLNAEERKAARASIWGPSRRFRRNVPPPSSPGVKVNPAEVATFPGAPLFEPKILRTFFLEFESEDWEEELEVFKKTDVDVPAKLTIDGKTYPDVGVHFRGMSSFMGVSKGWKRSLSLSLDFVHEGQNVGGYRNLNLLNSHGDPTFLRGFLTLWIARQYIPAPKANFARVVINGESWGVYLNAQQFDKDFVQDWFDTRKGARWKVPGTMRGGTGLVYLGDDPARYKQMYEIKTKDEPESWAALIRLCRVMNQTPLEKLEAALDPLLDIEGALKFLALENVVINSDGYWARASDYNLYQDVNGRFLIIPHDANETFAAPRGPGLGGGFGESSGIELDPLISAHDPDKPLCSRLLAVPALRTRYLKHVRDLAENWLDWNKLGPIAREFHALIAAEVAADIRKLESTEAFLDGLEGGENAQEHGKTSLKEFADMRRAYLLNHREIRTLAR